MWLSAQNVAGAACQDDGHPEPEAFPDRAGVNVHGKILEPLTLKQQLGIPPVSYGIGYLCTWANG